MIEIDLTPNKLKINRLGRRRCRELGMPIVGFATSCCLVNMWLAVDPGKPRRSELEELQYEIGELEQKLKDIAQRELAKEEREVRIEYERERRRQVPKLLEVLSSLAYQELSLSQISASPTVVSVRGYARDSGATAVFVNTIAEHCPESQVTVDGLRSSGSVREPMVSFTLRIQGRQDPSSLLGCRIGAELGDFKDNVQ